MAKLSEQELNERNKRIVKEYCAIAEQQPLATHYAILYALTKVYNLTPQMLGKIVTDAGVSVAKNN